MSSHAKEQDGNGGYCSRSAVDSAIKGKKIVKIFRNAIWIYERIWIQLLFSSWKCIPYVNSHFMLITCNHLALARTHCQFCTCTHWTLGVCWERSAPESDDDVAIPNIAHCTNGAWKSSTHRSKWAFIHRQSHFTWQPNSIRVYLSAQWHIHRPYLQSHIFTSLLIACNEIYMHHYFEFNSPLVSNGVARHCRLPFDWITHIFFLSHICMDDFDTFYVPLSSHEWTEIIAKISSCDVTLRWKSLPNSTLYSITC